MAEQPRPRTSSAAATTDLPLIFLCSVSQLACDFCLAMSVYPPSSSTDQPDLASTIDATTNSTETIYHLYPSVLFYRYGLDYDLHHISITYNALYNSLSFLCLFCRPAWSDLHHDPGSGDAVFLNRLMRSISSPIRNHFSTAHVWCPVLAVPWRDLGLKA